MINKYSNYMVLMPLFNLFDYLINNFFACSRKASSLVAASFLNCKGDCKRHVRCEMIRGELLLLLIYLGLHGELCSIVCSDHSTLKVKEDPHLHSRLHPESNSCFYWHLLAIAFVSILRVTRFNQHFYLFQAIKGSCTCFIVSKLLIGYLFH